MIVEPAFIPFSFILSSGQHSSMLAKPLLVRVIAP